jgi:transposase
MAKRNKQIDAEVIACASAGMTTREIAEKFTMSATTIGAFLLQDFV